MVDRQQFPRKLRSSLWTLQPAREHISITPQTARAADTMQTAYSKWCLKKFHITTQSHNMAVTHIDFPLKCLSVKHWLIEKLTDQFKDFNFCVRNKSKHWKPTSVQKIALSRSSLGSSEAKIKTSSKFNKAFSISKYPPVVYLCMKWSFLCSVKELKCFTQFLSAATFLMELVCSQCVSPPTKQPEDLVWTLTQVQLITAAAQHRGGDRIRWKKMKFT